MTKKTVLLLIPLLIFTLLTTGCAKQKNTFLDYQKDNFDCDASLEINGNAYSVNVKKTSETDYLLTFTEPQEIHGVSIEKNKDGIFLSAGRVHVPVKEGTNTSADLLKLFSLSKTDHVSTVSDMLGGVKATIWDFDCDFGNAKVYLSEESGYPLRMEADVYGNRVIMSFSRFAPLSENNNTAQTR